MLCYNVSLAIENTLIVLFLDLAPKPFNVLIGPTEPILVLALFLLLQLGNRPRHVNFFSLCYREQATGTWVTSILGYTRSIWAVLSWGTQIRRVLSMISVVFLAILALFGPQEAHEQVVKQGLVGAEQHIQRNLPIKEALQLVLHIFQ